MVCTQEEARIQMNHWGSKGTPFLFLIDFEGKSHCLFELNDPALPVRYSIPPESLQAPAKDYILPTPDWEIVPPSKELYKHAFTRVQEHIHRGDTYLLNLTFSSRLHTNADLESIYVRSRARYKLYWPGRFVVFSPECFVRIENDDIFSYPMKGTIDATLPNAKQKLLDDPKELAEHYTIVDLIRNDIGRISREVEVTSFRHIDRIEGHRGAIYQTSSEIRGKLDPDWPSRVGTILTDMLPAGSVSGAPKEKTLEIIRNVETGPRGFYTGVFGIFTGKKLDSAVLIRFVEKAGNELLFRSGGGITYQSRLDEEYNELIQKIYLPIAF